MKIRHSFRIKQEDLDIAKSILKDKQKLSNFIEQAVKEKIKREKKK